MEWKKKFLFRNVVCPSFGRILRELGRKEAVEGMDFAISTGGEDDLVYVLAAPELDCGVGGKVGEAKTANVGSFDDAVVAVRGGLFPVWDDADGFAD